MSEEAAVQTAEPTAKESLRAFFAQEAEPVDNLTPETPVEEVPVEEVPAEEPAEKPVEEKPEEPKTEEPKEPESDETDDDVEADLDYPSEEELFERLPRSVPKKVVKEMARYAAEARESNESIDRIGGSAYLGPLEKMVQAINATDENGFLGFFTGVNEAGGDEATVKLLKHALYAGIVKSPTWQATAETAEFGKDIAEATDAFLEMRFGASADRLKTAASWDADGTLDRFASFIENDFKDADGDFDFDKFYEASQAMHDEIRAIRNNPVNKKLAEENVALKRQQEKPAETRKPEDTALESSYGDYIGTAVDHVLDTVILKNSPLKDVAADTEDIKRDKAKFRVALSQQMREELAKHPSRSKLLSGFKVGKQGTSVYQTDFTKAVLDASNAIAKDRVWAEEMIAKLYGKTRNVQLAQKASAPATTTPAQPTVPTDFKPTGGANTRAERRAALQAGFDALG